MDQNISDAMNILFGIMVFIIAVSLTMYLFTTLSNTSESIFSTIGMAKYTHNLGLNADDNEDKIDDAIKKFDNRTVTKSTIIPMLHRYYKENFTVKLYDKNKNLKQVFDLGLEGEVARISGLTPKAASTLTEYEKAVKNTFGKIGDSLYLFTAPWRGAGLKTEKDEFTKQRVEMFINGFKSAINGIEVDYTDPNKGGWFSKLPENTKFIETVAKYQASGDVRINTEEEYRRKLSRRFKRY